MFDLIGVLEKAQVSKPLTYIDQIYTKPVFGVSYWVREIILKNMKNQPLFW